MPASSRSTWIGALLGAACCTACGHDWDAYAPGPGSSSASASGQGGAGASGGGATNGGGGAGGQAGDGGASTGGGGARGPVHCAGTSILTDAFDDPVASDQEISFPTDASVAGGEAIIPLPISTVALTRTFSGRRYHDLRDDVMAFEITKMVDAATTAGMYALIEFDADNYLRIRQRDGELQLLAYVADTSAKLVTDAWDPMVHAHWRFRESGGTTYLETSPDGLVWDPRLDIATSEIFELDLVDIEFGATLSGGEPAPDEARFGSLNAGMRTDEPWCKSSTLTDDFADGTRARAWARSSTGATCTLVETGGRLVVTLAADASNSCQYESAAAFDLTGDAVSLRVPVTTFGQPAGGTYLTLERSDSDEVEIVQSTDELVFRSVLGPTTMEHASIPYDPTEHAWWRIREAGGTTYFDVSADGTSWTMVTSTPNTIDLTALDVRFGLYNYDAPVAVPLVAEFDDYNLAP